MENMIPCPIQDQEVFQRVWQRVMAGRSEESSLIRPNPSVGSGDLSCGCLEALLRQEGGNPPPACRPEEPAPPMEQEPPIEEPAPEPEGPCAPSENLPPEDGAHRGSDLPRLWEEPQSDDDRTARLRRHVMDALEGWQFYRHLARRTRGTDARTLNSLAGELHRQAGRLRRTGMPGSCRRRTFCSLGCGTGPRSCWGRPPFRPTGGRCAAAIRRSSDRRAPSGWPPTTGRTRICWSCTASWPTPVRGGAAGSGPCWSRECDYLAGKAGSAGANGPGALLSIRAAHGGFAA